MYTGSIGDNGGIFFELTDLIDKDETLKLRGYEFNIDYYNTFTSASKHYNIEHKIHNSYPEFNESDKNKFKYLVQDRILHFGLTFLELKKYNKKYKEFDFNLRRDNFWIFDLLFKANHDARILLIVPENFLIGEIYKDIRKYLIQNDFIETIIHFPRKVLMNTFVESYLLIIDKNKNRNFKNKLILFESDEYFTEKLPLNEVEISLKDDLIPYYREFGSQYQQLPSRRIDVNKIDFLIDDLYKTKSKNKLQLNSSEVDDAIYFHANFNKIKIKKKLENENELSTFSDFISDIFPLASQNKHDIKKSNDNYVFFQKFHLGLQEFVLISKN